MSEKKFAYHIMADASANIDPELVEREDIQIIPMHYCVGDDDRVYSCAESDERIREYYSCQRDGRETHTTQISPQNYIDAFRPYAERGEKILYLSLSGGLSNTWQSSIMGATEISEDFPDSEIVCVDSLSATGGIGLLIEAACKNRAAGMRLGENAAWLEANKKRVCHWFMVDDLMFLKRGGRISATTATVGTALNIKPILRIEADGTLSNFAKKRGEKAAMSQLVSLYKDSSTREEGESVFIVHADNPAGADFLEAAVKKANPKAKVVKAYLTPIIGCHVGPGMCAIVHMGKPESARK